MRQLRFNPKALNSLPPVEVCPSCGSKFTPSGFHPECPMCRKIEKIVLEEMFDEKPVVKKYQQTQLQEYE